MDFARLLLGEEAATRDLERTALAFSKLPKDIIVHARKAVQKAGGGPPPDPTPPSATEVANAILAHPGLAHTVLARLRAQPDRVGAGPWRTNKNHWFRDHAWPRTDKWHVALVTPSTTNEWLWQTRLSLAWEPGSNIPVSGSGSAATHIEAKAAADAHLAEHGWVLL
jgi:hypothetical protein